MAKKKKEEEVVEKTPNEPKGDVTKVKANMKKPSEVIEQTITKVDLNNPPIPKEDEIKKDNTDSEGVVGVLEDTDAPKEREEVQPETQAQETGALEEVTGKEAVTEEEVSEVLASREAFPENIQKLVEFMEETGGDLNDYVKLNKDYSEVDNQTVLQEYYKQTKPHLDQEEINFLMEDQFSFDEDVDEDKDIRRKKLALKEQVANAKSHLEETKSKYYADLKGGSKLTSEQQEAVKYFGEQKQNEQKHKDAKTNFLNKTNRFFGDKFKGFEYNVGDKNYRFNVNDVNKVKDTQSDINNFIGKFLDEKGSMADEAGYHKSLFTAMNSDAVAKHFYEQGKSDALKKSIAESKNVNMDPRQELTDNVNTGGMKVKVLGDNSADFKFKIKNNKFKN